MFSRWRYNWQAAIAPKVDANFFMVSGKRRASAIHFQEKELSSTYKLINFWCCRWSSWSNWSSFSNKSWSFTVGFANSDSIDVERPNPNRRIVPFYSGRDLWQSVWKGVAASVHFSNRLYPLLCHHCHFDQWMLTTKQNHAGQKEIKSCDMYSS